MIPKKQTLQCRVDGIKKLVIALDIPRLFWNDQLVEMLYENNTKWYVLTHIRAIDEDFLELTLMKTGEVNPNVRY